MATYRENQDFANELLTDPLDIAIDYIGNNMNPEDVFSKETLSDFAVDFVGNHKSPEDVFNDDELKVWALSNGFIEVDEEYERYCNRRDNLEEVSNY